MEELDGQRRELPQSELDQQMMITNSTWGRSDVSDELKAALMKYYKEVDDQGNAQINASSLWGLLSYYTRDIRLGNLSEWNGELTACRYYLDLSGQLLYAGLIDAFLVCLSMAITIIETSQSKNGFVRRMLNTLRHENLNQNIEPPNRTFFGGNKQGGIQ